MPKLNLFLKTTGALCKLNYDPFVRVYFCTKHHCTVSMGLTVPELLAQRLDTGSANYPVLFLCF